MSTPSPFENLPPNDPVYSTLPPDVQALNAPNLDHAGFWVLLWAAVRSLLLGITSLVSGTARSATATEQIATTVQSYTTRPAPRKPLKLEAPESFNGLPHKVDAFIHALTLYFDGQEISDDGQRIIFVLSLVKGGSGDITGNWADLQRKLIVEFQNGDTTNAHLRTW